MAFDTFSDDSKLEPYIHTSDEKDLEFWMEKFGANRIQLFDAIRRVGLSADDVGIYLQSGVRPLASKQSVGGV